MTYYEPGSHIWTKPYKISGYPRDIDDLPEMSDYAQYYYTVIQVLDTGFYNIKLTSPATKISMYLDGDIIFDLEFTPDYEYEKTIFLESGIHAIALRLIEESTVSYPNYENWFKFSILNRDNPTLDIYSLDSITGKFILINYDSRYPHDIANSLYNDREVSKVLAEYSMLFNTYSNNYAMIAGVDNTLDYINKELNSVVYQDTHPYLPYTQRGTILFSSDIVPIELVNNNDPSVIISDNSLIERFLEIGIVIYGGNKPFNYIGIRSEDSIIECPEADEIIFDFITDVFYQVESDTEFMEYYGYPNGVKKICFGNEFTGESRDYYALLEADLGEMYGDTWCYDKLEDSPILSYEFDANYANIYSNYLSYFSLFINQESAKSGISGYTYGSSLITNVNSFNSGNFDFWGNEKPDMPNNNIVDLPDMKLQEGKINSFEIEIQLNSMGEIGGVATTHDSSYWTSSTPRTLWVVYGKVEEHELDELI
jgi:hypothetical protein